LLTYFISQSVGDYDDPLDRMLAILRFTFTKELKFVVSRGLNDFTKDMT
jgi:hypothetical protein